MNSLSLSYKKEKVLPEKVKGIDGWHEIDPDFRVILRCLRVLVDEDIEEKDRVYLLLLWFFKGEFVPDGVKLFCDFVRNGEKSEDDDDDPLMDYEQDADAIYSSVLQQYGIDLFEVEKLHWYKFVALVSGLGEGTALRNRMSLRDLDTSKLEGKSKVKAEKAKNAVRLEVKMSRAEKEIQRQMDEALSKGEDVSEIIKRIQVMNGE